MSCIITYKGQKYSEEQFKEYFINNKQEFATSIAKNKDVIDSFKRKMEGIDFVFSQSPELASIGSKAQYIQYLSIIFPDSKVKDIVYHGTDNPNFLGFGSDFSRAIHFGTLQAAKDRRLHTDFEFKRNAKFIPVILNIKNPLKTEVDFNFEGEGLEFVDDPDFDFTKEQGHRLLITYLHNKGYNVYHPEGGVYRDGEILNNAGLDSVIYKNEREDKGNYSYAVFEPEQIHILGSQADIQGFKDFVQGKQFQKLTAEEKAKTIKQPNTLFGLNIQNQEQLEFHVNTLNVVSKFLENVGVEERLVSEFLSQDGSVVEGAIAAANFIEGTVDIIDDLNKGRAEAWNKLPEEAAHWWYRLLDTNSELKDALLMSGLTDRKEKELRNSLYGDAYKGPRIVGKLALDAQGNVTQKPALSPIREEAIGQLIAEAIKRIETKNANTSDYSFFKKFLDWINSIIDIFKTTTQDPFEVAAMKILSSDMSDLMTWEEYRKLNNIVNFADVLTEQSVSPVDYTIISDLGKVVTNYFEPQGLDEKDTFKWVANLKEGVQKNSPEFNTQQELDNWVSANIKEHDIRQRQLAIEVRDNQIFFDRLLNKTFRKKSKFLPKTLRKYFNIIDAQNINPLREWNISQELQQITKKLTEQEKKQIIETNGYTNIAPTLKVLPDLLQKYGRKTTPEIIKQEIEITNKLVKKEITKEQATELRQKVESKKKGNPIVLSQPIKIDGAKKQELSILNGIREMIKLENPNLKSITAEEFVAEAHNWLKTNYLLGFANETGINGEISSGHPGYNVPNTFVYYDKNRNISKKDLENYRNLTEEQIRNLSPEERQMYLDIAGIGNRQYDIYHNKISIRFNDFSHFAKNVILPHFQKRIDGEEGIIPSAWGNLTYFYTGKNKWKDAVLLHEIQNDNIEFLREFKNEKVDLETSLGRYLQQLNTDLLDNITQIESGGKKIIRRDSSEEFIKTHLQLNYQLLQLKDLPLEQGLLQLKQNLNEKIELYKSDNSVRNNIDKAQEVVDEAYSRRRIFQDFQKRGGIKSLLTKEELQNLEDILKRLNTEEVEGEAMWLPEENQFEPGFPSIRNLERKKRDFSNEVIAIQTKINDKLRDMYGDNVPLINLTAPAKPRTKSQIRQGVQKSQELNENVNWLLAYSEKKILDNLSKTIEESKKNYIRARNVTNAYNFNVQLSKITLEQWTNLVENYKYNVDLLNRLIDEQAKKDIKAKSSEINPEDNPLITSQFYKTLSPTNLPSDSKVYTGNEFHFGTFEFGYGTIWTSEKFPNNLYIEISNSNIGVIKKSDLKDAILKSNSKENRKIEQQSQFESLKQKALDKKAELEKNYGKIEEEVKQTLEIEMNYFTPLVHHLIQKHINQYGKDFPMYFSGYQITKLTQNNDRTAWIYAGKDEINIVNKNTFDYNNQRFGILKYGEQEYQKSYKKDGKDISQQEYEKAYQQATERRAKEIKFIAASNIGIIKFSDFEGTIQGVSEETNVKKLSDKQLEEGIKALNEFKKIPKSDPRSKYNYKSNADVVIEKLLEINNNEPIETGAIYNAMSQISGVKLVWQDKIEGLQGNTGGYLVDLSNYNYNTPILYGLNTNKVGSQQDIEGFKDFVQGKQFQKLTAEEKAKTIEQVTKEHRPIAALKDLAAKLAHRIGGRVEFENNPNADWKGYNQGNTSVLNEAYMTPDTPFHEILAHPIIRAIKNKNVNSKLQIYEGSTFIQVREIDGKNWKSLGTFKTKEDAQTFIKNNSQSQLYQSLLKELETGRGKEVFESVKKNYPIVNDISIRENIWNYLQKYALIPVKEIKFFSLTEYNTYRVNVIREDGSSFDHVISVTDIGINFTAEQQQEEAIVTLLGELAAGKLEEKENATLKKKLLEFWKQISDFVKSLLRQDGIKIDELPITTTLNDLAEIMAYGNNKIILPGYKVEYSTPLGNKYDTLEEVNNEIRGLANANVEVDLSGIKIPDLTSQIENLKKQLKDFEYEIEPFNDFVDVYTTEGRLRNNEWTLKADGTEWYSGKENKTLTKDNYKGFVLQNRNKLLKISKERAKEIYYAKENNHNTATQKSRDSYAKLETELHFLENLGIKGFIEKNKEYEQSKEIIEQWKKENNIQYDPEEVYSRGQGFYSSIGAYSNLELDLLLKNLIQHIEDNKKADGEFTISAFTKPIDKRLKHIEGTGDRVRFVIYPKSNHIKWAAPTDVHSGSVWDAHEKVSKDKKSELLGVSFTKAPALSNINEVSPNLADIIDNLSHVHNELGIELTTNNFRIEYDDNIDYSTKKLINNINKILDDKYGKLVKPEIKKEVSIQKQYIFGNEIFDTYEQAKAEVDKFIGTEQNEVLGFDYSDIKEIQKPIGKQPTQTRENTTSIESVKDKIVYDKRYTNHPEFKLDDVIYKHTGIGFEKTFYDEMYKYGEDRTIDITEDEYREAEKKYRKQNNIPDEDNQQALINLKVAALKEVARKYPRSLITSKVVPINPNLVDNSEIQYSKISSQESKSKIEKLFNNQTNEVSNVKPDVILPIGTSGSGKSTFIKSLPQENLVIIEPDAMRVEFTGDINNKSKDKEIYIEAANRAIKAIKQGKQVVFDTTNLTKEKRRPFIEAIRKEFPNANIQYKLMELNPELAKQRIKNRLKTNPPVEKFDGFWNRSQVANQTNKVFLFGDNTNDRTVTNYVPSMTQAVIRGLPNAIGIDTKKDRGTSINSYLTDNDLEWFKGHVDTQIQKAKDSGKTIVVPADGIGTGKAMLKEKAPKLFKYLQEKLRELELTQGANVSDATIDRHAESYKQMLEDIKDEGITNYDDNQQFQNLTDKEESEYYSEYNKNDENSNNLQSTESILETNPKLKKFIEDITDEDGSISLFKYNKIINDKEKFGNLPVMKTITKLNNILKNAVNRLWDNRINAENNLKIKFVESLEDEDAVAQFLRKENEIHISKNIFLNILDKDFKDYPEFYTGYLLNHELIHYLTPQSLSIKPQFIDRLLLNEKSDMYLKNLYEREFVKNIKNLYNFSISQLEDLSDYGFTNLAEFVTEAMSNPRFQVKLSTIKYKNENKSLWKKFIKILSDYLSSITGNSIEDTVLEAVISEVTNYITENSNIERTYKTKINNSGDTQFYFVFNKNSEIGIEQEEINNYDNSDNENFEFNEDLTGNEYIENIDNKYLIKFEELLNKGVITQICN